MVSRPRDVFLARGFRWSVTSFRDERRFVAVFLAFADFKSVVADCIEKRGVNALHNCPGRLLRFDPLPKLLQKILTAFDFNENTLSRVRHVAVESQLRRQTVNKRAKPDSLHSTAHDYFQSFVVGTDGSPSRSWRALAPASTLWSRPTGADPWRANSGFHIANEAARPQNQSGRREKNRSRGLQNQRPLRDVDERNQNERCTSLALRSQP